MVHGSSGWIFCRIELLRFGNLLRIAWIMAFPNCFECGKKLNCLELLGSWFFRIALNSIRIASGPAGAPGPGGAPPGPGPGPARPRAPGHRPGRLQFELNSKHFGKIMIQAIQFFTAFKAIRKSHDPSNSIFHNKFAVKMHQKCPKHLNSNFNSNSLTPGST